MTLLNDDLSYWTLKTTSVTYQLFFGWQYLQTIVTNCFVTWSMRPQRRNLKVGNVPLQSLWMPEAGCQSQTAKSHEPSQPGMKSTQKTMGRKKVSMRWHRCCFVCVLQGGRWLYLWDGFARTAAGEVCPMDPGVYTYGITSRVWSTATKESLGYEGSYMALTRVRSNLKRLFTWFDDFLQAGACWADVTKYCRFIMLMNHVISFHEFWEAPGFTCRQ